MPNEKRIVVSEADALQFACNAVDLDGRVIMNRASPELQTRLRAVGFKPVLTPLSEFLKAGGTAKCLTLHLVGLPARPNPEIRPKGQPPELDVLSCGVNDGVLARCVRGYSAGITFKQCHRPGDMQLGKI